MSYALQGWRNPPRFLASQRDDALVDAGTQAADHVGVGFVPVGRARRQRRATQGGAAVIRIAITIEAFEAIAATLLLAANQRLRRAIMDENGLSEPRDGRSC